MQVADTSHKSLVGIAGVIAHAHPDIVAMIVEFQRKKLSELVRNHFLGAVAYGPFKGLRLATDAHWGGADQGAMTLGLYEQEVLAELQGLPRGGVLIDLGAGDGYYGIGGVVSGQFRKSYCFEISEKGRAVIAENAAANLVADRIVILGEASETFYEQIDPRERDGAVVLVDIEGGEFDVLTPRAFQAFARSTIIVEIHDWLPGGQAKLQQLEAAAAATHRMRSFRMGQRDLSAIGEVAGLSDTDRWLLCSEGRRTMMSWRRFDPA